MELRQQAAYIARSRVGLGLVTLAFPGAVAGACFGRAANTPTGRAITRLTGARDAVIGAGGSISAGQGVGGADWLSMSALVDALDGVIMLASPGLPKRARLVGLAALGSAGYHLMLSKQLAAEEHPDDEIAAGVSPDPRR
jgi:hypothetical protein